MVKTNSFGNAEDMNYSLTYEPHESEEYISERIDRVGDFAAAAKIPLKIYRHEKDVRFEFDRTGDYLLMRDVIAEFHETNHQSVHTITSNHPGYIHAWALAAHEVLQDMGIKVSVEVESDSVVIDFPTSTAMTMFTTLNETGYFDRLANNRMNTVGPPPPGSVPY